jgi:peptidyl-prolyl cis-trans isomerase C
MQPMTARGVCFFLIIFVAAVTVNAEDQTSSPPMATVNGVAISQENFNFEFQQEIGRRAQGGQPVNEEMIPMVQQQVRERLIEEELLYQDTQAQGIVVGDQRVADELAGIKQRFPSEEEFQTALTTLKTSEDELKRKIQRSFAIRELISKLVADVHVTDEEIKTFYDGNPSLFVAPEQVQARHILIKVAPEAEADQKKKARQKITAVQKKIKSGEDFAGLAQTYSEGPSSVKGGDLGFFQRGQMVKPFEDAAFALKKDEVSDVVETRFGYHLIQVTDRRPEGTISYEDAKPRIAQNIKKEKDGQIVREHIKKLRAKADIQPQSVAAPPAKPTTGG